METCLPEMLGSLLNSLRLVALFTGFQLRRRCFRGGDAPSLLADKTFCAFFRNFNAFAFSACLGTGTAVITAQKRTTD